MDPLLVAIKWLNTNYSRLRYLENKHPYCTIEERDETIRLQQGWDHNYDIVKAYDEAGSEIAGDWLDTDYKGMINE